MSRSGSRSPEPETSQTTKMPIEDLQNAETREHMKTVHKLRRCGLSNDLPLPQVVLCGDQSSGKSSVGQRLTGFKLPTNVSLCTRFATEIILSALRTTSARASIIPGPDRGREDVRILESFKRNLSSDYSELPEIIEEVTKLVIPERTYGLGPRAFARDVLSIEISGPNCPDLAIVDLPGLISSSNKKQSNEDIQVVNEIVDDYIRRPNTIVLAVVKADNEQACQSITGRVERLGALERTLGIITKPDRLEPGSENEKTWVELALNQDVKLGLGWHMLRNPSDTQPSEDPEQLETSFFSGMRERYLDLSDEILGAPSLSRRVSQLLQEQLRENIPKLRDQVMKHQRNLSQVLRDLGEPRSSPSQQKDFLIRLAHNFEKLASLSISGDYDDAFFSVIGKGKPIEGENIRRLRAVEKYANKHFGAQMRRFGTKYEITEVPNELVDLGYPEEKDFKLDEQYSRKPTQQKAMKYSAILDWVQHRQELFRGSELPTTTNSKVIANLFRELSEPWGEIARQHIDRFTNYCERFAWMVCKHIAPDHNTASNIFKYQVMHRLDERREAALEELEQIITGKNGHIVTCNSSAVVLCQQIQSKIEAEKRAQAINATTSMGSVYDHTTGRRRPNVTADLVTNPLPVLSVETDGEKYVAQKGFIETMATYKNELTCLNDLIVRCCIERHLLQGFPTDVFAMSHVKGMTDAELKRLGSEKQEKVQQRGHLKAQLERFNDGVAAFRVAAVNL